MKCSNTTGAVAIGCYYTSIALPIGNGQDIIITLLWHNLHVEALNNEYDALLYFLFFYQSKPIIGPKQSKDVTIIE